MLKQTQLDAGLLAAVSRAQGATLEEESGGDIAWYSIKKWEDGSPHYDKLDDITTGTDGPGHHLEYGENHGHPEHVIGVKDGAPKAAEAKAYLDQHADKYSKAHENADSEDPNDHDHNAALHVTHSRLYHGVANLLRHYGAPGELHATVLAGLQKLGQHHANEASKSQAVSVFGSEEHHDVADGHLKAAHDDFSHHLGLTTRQAPFDHTRD